MNIKTLSIADFENVKTLSKDLFLLSYAPLDHMAEFSTPSWGYALFDHNGNLLRLFGHPKFLAKCKKHGIMQGTCWGESDCETPIIRNTIEKAIRCSGVLGAQDDPDCHIYTAPLSLDLERVGNAFSSYKVLLSHDIGKSIFSRERICLFGCVAIISFDSTIGQDGLFYSALTENAAREISLQLHWFCAEFTDLSKDTGDITLDQSRGQQEITFLSSNIYSFFGLQTNLSFRLKLLNQIIDPEPANQQFWDIVKNRSIVTMLPMNISGNGHTISTYVTTTRSIEPRFYMVEYNIYFRKQDTKAIVDNTANQHHLATFKNIICVSENFSKSIDMAKNAARNDATILITGESGSGKDLIAQAVHSASARAAKPFITLNCAAIPSELIASELFGYEQGSFTGAKKGGSQGKFELANGGTLFLDEIGDMPIELQAHLLRVIEQKRFMKIGGNKEISVDVRIIAATNANLEELVNKKQFRVDLYYRLNIINIWAPPLRQRHEDIIPLTEYFLQDAYWKKKKQKSILSDSAKLELLQYSWPGNIRELKSVCERISNADLGPIITKENVEYFINPKKSIEVLSSNKQNMASIVPDEESGEKPKDSNEIDDTASGEFILHKSKTIDRSQLIVALQNCKSNVSDAAKLLGISRSTMYRLLHKEKIL